MSHPYKDSDRMAGERKSNKPLLEKKRRARINKSLEQLKQLVLEALKKDSARYSKLEKADILEMTVKHLKEMQRHQMAAAVSVDPSVLPKYRAGFSECAEEVNRYLSTIDGLSADMRMRLLSHLSDCMSHVNTTPYSPPLGALYPPATPLSALPGYQQHPVHVAYPELLPAEMLARTVLPPVVRSSPELSPSENRALPPSPRGFSPPTASTPLTHPHHVMKQEVPLPVNPRTTRPLAEINSNSPAPSRPLVASVKTEAPPRGGDRHVPLHIPLHVDVKQEPMWRPW